MPQDSSEGAIPCTTIRESQSSGRYCNTLQSHTDVYQSSRRPHDNPSPELRTALHELQEMVTKRIARISPADKGGVVVVQDMANYIFEAKRQLQTEWHCSKVKKDPTVQIAKTSNELVNRLHIDGHINNITCRWALVEPNNVRCHQFHLQDIDKPTRVTYHVMCKQTLRESVQAHGPLDAGPHCQPVQLHQGHHSHAAYTPAMQTVRGWGEACHHRHHRTLHQHVPPWPPHRTPVPSQQHAPN